MKYIYLKFKRIINTINKNIATLPASSYSVPRRRGNIRGWTDKQTISNLHSSAEKSTSVPAGLSQNTKSYRSSHSERSEESSLSKVYWILQSLRSFRMTTFISIHSAHQKDFVHVLSAKTASIFLSIAAIFLFTSCEQTVDVELPYVEQLVVRGIIEEGEPITDLSVTKTLPPLENYDYMNESKYFLADAQVTLEVNGEIFHCNYNEESKYECPDYIPKAGDKIKLSAKWNNKHVTAETVIPDSTSVVKYEYDKYSSQYDDGGENLRIYAYLYPQEGFAYAGTWKYMQDNYDFASYRYTMVRSSLKNNEGLIKVKCFDESSWFFNFGEFKDWNEFISNIEAKLFTYDEAVYDYYTNFDEYNSDDFLFGSSGQNLDWNVEGDGFGIFVGKNTTMHKIDIEIE